MRLNRDAIVDMAVDITRSDGLSAVTMRAVAARFDVTAMALYRHVSDREGLIRLVADRIGRLVCPQSSTGASWDERARAWATAQRDVLRQYPGVAAWLIDNGPAGPAAYDLLEVLVAALADAGFDDATVARGAASIMSWTFTRVAVEDLANARVRRRVPDRTVAFLGGLSGIDAASHPVTSRVGPELLALPLPEIFDAGLGLILAGLTSERPR
ncbi:TetR/AcrR family transcriptional regulator C-terminal domain-containing protein [Micromonospora sp. WMMD961]|uniref:TetR/AcrR family transcriptional regulator n=1 Tax=Micromonospora sp. WMMD961 TaxID=3016100 RepID=UPI002416244F|nr:TetR/AcrR family transcriptional regulator C-terminal domain-containing protein [Micromonospora sp. WMMD961]MDG4782328.1 TetR/AcrR family transcriptional regulator C-terminal domain-containing protein [Micromonospora sp. WMMD961]